MKFLNNIGFISFCLSIGGLLLLLVMFFLPQSSSLIYILGQFTFPLIYTAFFGSVLSLILHRSRKEVKLGLFTILIILIFGLVILLGAALAFHD